MGYPVCCALGFVSPNDHLIGWISADGRGLRSSCALPGGISGNPAQFFAHLTSLEHLSAGSNFVGELVPAAHARELWCIQGLRPTQFID